MRPVFFLFIVITGFLLTLGMTKDIWTPFALVILTGALLAGVLVFDILAVAG